MCIAVRSDIFTPVTFNFQKQYISCSCNAGAGARISSINCIDMVTEIIYIIQEIKKAAMV